MKKSVDTKKMVYLQERTLIDGIANDEAAIYKRPTSGIIELHLLNSMLPQNRNAAAFIRLLYSDSEMDIERTFNAVFGYLAAGINWEARETNARPLVMLYHEASINSAVPTGKEKEWPYIASQLDSIAEKLERAAATNKDHERDLRKDAEYVRDIISEIEKHPEYIRFASITSLILSNWEWLNNFTRTYRLLSVLATMQNGIRNDAETRYNLVRILKEISMEWTD